MSNAKEMAAAKKAAAAENTVAATSTPADEMPVIKHKAKGRQFTYVGAGAGSPYVITLMGKQKFTRGELTEVTDPEILMKIGTIPTFVEGEADAATLHEIDREGEEKYKAQIAQDLLMNARYTKKHRGE